MRNFTKHLFAFVLLCAARAVQAQTDDCPSAPLLISRDYRQKEWIEGSDGSNFGAGDYNYTTPCNGNPGVFTRGDVWYHFIAVSEKHTVEVRADGPLSRTMGILVGGCPGQGGRATCVGTSPYSEGIYRYQRNVIELDYLTIGEKVYIQVVPNSSTLAGGAGDFEISITHVVPPPVPANDSCIGAFNLPSSVWTNGSTHRATGLGYSCPTPEASRSVWYKFVASSSTAYEVSVDGDPGFDAVVTAYPGCCTPAIKTASLTGDGRTEELKLYNLVQGNTYYLQIRDKENDTTFNSSFNLLLKPLTPPPANDICSGATWLYPAPTAQYTAGSTHNAVDNGILASCPAGSTDKKKDVWYKFTSTNTIATVKVKGNLIFDAVVGAYSDCSTYAQPSGGECTNGTGVGGEETLSLRNLVRGETYYIRVFDVMGDDVEAAAFDICVIQPPLNDLCENARIIAAGRDCSLALSGTTASASFEEFGCYTAPDVWYKFVATATAHKVTVSSQGACDPMISVVKDACSSVFVDGGNCTNKTGLAGSEELIAYNLTIGTTYYIKVIDYSNSRASSSFSICVSAAILNDNCSEAIRLTADQPLNGATSFASPNAADIGCAINGTTSVVWYKFVATAATHGIIVDGEPGFDAVIGAFNDCSSGSKPVGGDCTTNTADGGMEGLLLTNLTVGTAYYISVHDRQGDAGTNSTFTINLVTPPAHNFCAGALNIDPQLTCSFTKGSVKNTVIVTETGSCVANKGSVWYKFTATALGHLVSVQGIGNFKPAVGVLSACGATNRPTGGDCKNINGTDNTVTLRLSDLTLGNTYYVQISNGADNADTEFNICISIPECDAPTLGEVTFVNLTTAKLSWSPAIGTFLVEYGAAATFGTPGTAGVAGNANNKVVKITDNSTLDLKDLAALKEYSYVVRKFCPEFGNRYSANSVLGTFITPPTNDICSGAVNLIPSGSETFSPISGSLNAATNTGEFRTLECVDGAPASVWYKFTATHTIHKVTVTNPDVVLSAYTSCDLTTRPVGGKCTAVSAAYYIGSIREQYMALSELTKGSTYYIQVAHKRSITSGVSFTIGVTTPPPPPANDKCAGAISLIPDATEPVRVSGTLHNALDNDVTSDCSMSNRTNHGQFNVWYKFVSTANIATIVVNSNGPIVTAIGVSNSCETPQQRCVAQNVPTNLYTNKIEINVAEGTTYYIQVYDIENRTTPNAAFDISIIQPFCASPVPSPVTDITQTTAQLNWDSDNTTYIEYGPKATFGTPGTMFGAPNRLNTFITPGRSAKSVVLTNLLPETEYSFVIRQQCRNGWSKNSAIQSFTTAILPPPPNDVCANAITLRPALSCSFTPGNTLNSRDDNETGDCTDGTEKAVWYRFTAASAKQTITVVGGQTFNPVIAAINGCGADARPVGGACKNSTGEGGLETMVLTGLTIGNTYYVQVHDFNGENTDKSTFDICINYCPEPILSAVTAIGATSAKINWSTTGDYVVEYAPTSLYGAPLFGTPGTADVAGHANNSIETAFSDDFLVLTNLIPNIEYSYVVRQICAADDGSYGFSANTNVRKFKTTNPNNDLCSDALLLTSDYTCKPFTGSTAGATDQNINACGFALGARRDVWFKFVAVATTHNVSIVANDASVFTPYFGVYNDCAATSSPAGGTCSIISNTLRLTGLTIGNTYYIQVYDRQGSDRSDALFTVCITHPLPPPPPAPNDICALATEITPAATCTYTNGTTHNARTDAGDDCRRNGVAVWYKFKATATVHHVMVDGDAGFDAIVGAKAECGTTDFVPGGFCADNTSDGGVETLILTGLTVGNMYYIQVSDYQNDNKSTSTFKICVTVPACMPVTPAAVTEVKATSAKINWDLSAGTFIVEYMLRTQARGPGIGANAGSSTNKIARVTNANSVVLTDLVPLSEYIFYIRQDCSGAGKQYSTNTSFVSFKTTAPLPVNDVCANAVEIFSHDGGCSQTSGTILHATGDDESDLCYRGSKVEGVWYKFTAISSDHRVMVRGDNDLNIIAAVFTDCTNKTAVNGGGCTDRVGPNEFEVLDLKQLTIGKTYYVFIYAFAVGSSTTFTICLTRPPCETPTLAEVTNIKPNAAQVNWVTEAGTFLVEYGQPSAFTPGTGGAAGSANNTLIRVTDKNLHVLNDLLPNTQYSYVIRQVCRETTYSENSPVQTFKTALQPPANDVCAGAVNITPSFTCTPTKGSTYAATDNTDQGNCASEEFGKKNEVWFSFTASAVSHTVTVDGDANFDAILNGYSECGSSARPFAWSCINATAQDGIETLILSDLIIGETYRVQIYDAQGRNSETSTFNICVTQTICAAATLARETNISASTAQINWSSNSGDFIVEYGPAVTFGTPGAGEAAGNAFNSVIPARNVNALVLQNLSPMTDYSYVIRQYCSGVGYSKNSSIQTFTTVMQTQNALHLDGTNDYVDCGNGSALQISTGTVEAWIKTSGAGSSYRSIIVKQDAYGLYLKDNVLIAFCFNGAGDLSTGVTLNDNKWHHVAMSFLSGVTNGVKIYVDGELKLTTTCSSSFLSSNTNYNLFVGAGGIGYNQEFNGSIDEARIWNVARTQPQIQATMNTEVMAQTGLVACYHFNQGTASGTNTSITTVTDASNNGISGTLTNAALTGSTSNWVSGFEGLTKNALHFDGVDDIVNIKMGTNAIIAPFTVETWIKPTTLGDVGILGTRSLAADNSFDIQLTADGGLHGDIGDGTNWLSTSADVPGSSAKITTGNWHHIAYVVTTSGYTIYVNGIEKGRGTLSGTALLYNNLTTLQLGAFGDLYEGFNFNGCLDEVRIWNVARTATQIRDNMGLALAAQTGLIARYHFNQAEANAENAGENQLIDGSGSGFSGTLKNLSLSGATSNWVNGFYLSPNCVAALPSVKTSISQSVSNRLFSNSECGLLALVKPSSGDDAVSGMVDVTVWKQPDIFSLVKRNYEITPKNNPGTAAGTVTLYFTQAEFDAYNVSNIPKLPTGPTDEAGKANAIIFKYSGKSSDNSGSPTSYSGFPQRIVPKPENIVWNSGGQYWEITFEVTGFSGFMLGTGSAPLPVELLRFEGKPAKEGNLLTWQTANEVNNKGFHVERLKGNDWQSIGFVAAQNKAATYNFTDNAPLSTSYYRLRQIDSDGTATLSKIISIATNSNSALKIYPNPVTNSLTIETDLTDDFQIINLLGQQVMQGGTTPTIDVSALPAGIYVFSIGEAQIKFVKQ